MKSLLFASLLLLAFIAQSQTLDREYVEGIRLGMDKKEAISKVVQHFNTYFLEDKNGIIKAMKKEKGKKLEKLEARIAFLAEVGTEIRSQLEKLDDWSQADLHSKFLVHITTMLGEFVTIPGLAPKKAYPTGYGSITLFFRNGRLAFVGGNLSLVSDYTVWSGFAYTDETLKSVSESITANFGKYTHNKSQSSFISHICGKPTYTHTFTITSDAERSGWFQFSFNPYGREYKNNSGYNCRYIQHQLDDVYFQVSLKE